MRSMFVPALAAVVLTSTPAFAQDAAVASPPSAPPSPPPTSPATPPTTVQAPVLELPSAGAPRPPVEGPDSGSRPVPAAAPNKDDSPLAADGHPLAGYHNGLFYLRDHDDNFRLHVQGRAQIDAFTYFGPGVPQTALKPTILLRRIRPEITGEFLHHFWFMLAGDFGATNVDNANGRNETSASSPGQAPTVSTARFAGAQTTRVSAAPTDVFGIYRYTPALSVQVGQFDAPFTMENRTSDKYTAFMERALPARALGVPANKEMGAMVFGELPQRVLYYSAGVFNGDGMNRLNTDGSGDVMARVYSRPLAARVLGPLKDLQIGASFRYGMRDHKSTSYDYPAFTTQSGYAFWSPGYKGSAGNTHVIPSGKQLGVGGELRVPISNFDLTSEVVYVDNGTRESLEGYQATNSERFGSLKGASYYVQLGYWPLGGRDVQGLPGDENLPHVDFSKNDPAKAVQALQLLVKWEQFHVKYASAGRSGVVDPSNVDGDIDLNALSFGANYWATKHVRLSINYVVDMFPGSAPLPATTTDGPVQGPGQRAIAPANGLAKGLDDGARDHAHTLNELLFRVALAL